MRQRTAKRWFRRMSEPIWEILLFGGIAGIIGLTVLAALIYPFPAYYGEQDGERPKEAFLRQNDSKVFLASDSRDFEQKVSVASVPDGEAPMESRKAWVGIIFPEAKLLKGVYARGIATGELEGPADYWAVESAIALELLRAKDPSAAEWFAARVFPGQLLLFRVS